MLTIAIVEDSMEYADMLKKRIYNTDFKDKIFVESYLKPGDFLNELHSGKRYQLCFSDIKMPDMDGVKLAEEIRKTDGRMLLIFLSSYLEYATEGYRLNAFEYLLKDRVDDKWKTLFKRIIKRLEEDREKVYRVIMQNRVEIIPLNSIIYIFKESKYCNFVLEGSGDKIAIRKTLAKIEEELQPHKHFIQINKGYLINIEKIRKYTAQEVMMENGEMLVIGRMHIARVKRRVMRYVEER